MSIRIYSFIKISWCLTQVKQKGRPKSVPKNDITLARVHHMRFMGVPAKDIAEEIGASRRTFYRRFEQIKYKNLDPDTPFSKWI